MAGLEAAREALRVADATDNPTARSMAHCALGRALADSEPEQALAYLTKAFELAATVENNWLTGMARMEAAAITSEHGDPAAATQMFLELLEHWERGGPGILAQQWDTLRHITRLLVRLDDQATAATLYRTLLKANAVNLGVSPAQRCSFVKHVVSEPV